MKVAFLFGVNKVALALPRPATSCVSHYCDMFLEFMADPRLRENRLTGRNSVENKHHTQEEQVGACSLWSPFVWQTLIKHPTRLGTSDLSQWSMSLRPRSPHVWNTHDHLIQGWWSRRTDRYWVKVLSPRTLETLLWRRNNAMRHSYLSLFKLSSQPCLLEKVKVLWWFSFSLRKREKLTQICFHMRVFWSLPVLFLRSRVSQRHLSFLWVLRIHPSRITAHSFPILEDLLLSRASLPSHASWSPLPSINNDIDSLLGSYLTLGLANASSLSPGSQGDSSLPLPPPPTPTHSFLKPHPLTLSSSHHGESSCQSPCVSRPVGVTSSYSWFLVSFSFGQCWELNPGYHGC